MPSTLPLSHTQTYIPIISDSLYFFPLPSLSSANVCSFPESEWFVRESSIQWYVYNSILEMWNDSRSSSSPPATIKHILIWTVQMRVENRKSNLEHTFHRLHSKLRSRFRAIDAVKLKSEKFQKYWKILELRAWLFKSIYSYKIMASLRN